MNVLIPCTHCDRYVRSQEERCPFCSGALAATAARPVARALLRSPSRAAAFALRTALVVAPVTLACGGDEGKAERDAEGSGGSAQNAAGASPGAGASAGAPALDGEADAGSPDAGFVPVPIYGGVFPDPLTRARV